MNKYKLKIRDVKTHKYFGISNLSIIFTKILINFVFFGDL